MRLRDCASARLDEAAALLRAEFGAGVGGQRERQAKDEDAWGLVEVEGGGAERVVAFAVVRPAAKDPVGARTALVASVVVDRNRRGRGLGTRMMDAIEATARASGHFAYTSVWAAPSVKGFYTRRGYAEVGEPVNNASKVLGKAAGDLSSLQKLLGARVAKDHPNDTDVCLRKRLVERTAPPAAKSDEDFLADVAEELRGMGRGGEFEFRIQAARNVAWERQIGPSCGLAALRMALRSFGADEDRLDGLLTTARSMGASSDGEMFDITHLADVARKATASTIAVPGRLDISVEPVTAALLESFDLATTLVVFPYDKGSGPGRPELRRGLSAHYCVLIARAQLLKERALVAVHGASSRLISATTSEWIASNAQLLERDTQRYKDEADVGINLAGLCLVMRQSSST